MCDVMTQTHVQLHLGQQLLGEETSVSGVRDLHLFLCKALFPTPLTPLFNVGWNAFTSALGLLLVGRDAAPQH